MLRQRHTLPPAEAVRLLRQMLDGVAAVHAAGIIHRDVKPENLLVDTFRELPWLKLTDFGVARLSYGASLTNLTSVIGTPEYMAPELAEHESATPAADLYSAGIVLYEMLCGRTPFAGGHPLAVMRRHADQPPPPIPGIPPALQDYLGLLLAKDPRSRPKAATEAAAALAPLESSLASLPAPPPMQAPGHGVTPASAIPGGSVSPQRPVADLAGSATVLRHRDRGHAADENSNGQHHSPGGRPGGPLASAPKRGAWRSRPMALAGLAAAVIVVAAAAATMLVPHSHQAPPRSMAATSYYVFSPQQYRNGLLISRRWALGGTNGSLLTETVTASSTTGKPIRVPFQETIPAAVAPNLRTVHFTPTPNKIIPGRSGRGMAAERPSSRKHHRWVPGCRLSTRGHVCPPCQLGPGLPDPSDAASRAGRSRADVDPTHPRLDGTTVSGAIASRADVTVSSSGLPDDAA